MSRRRLPYFRKGIVDLSTARPRAYSRRPMRPSSDISSRPVAIVMGGCRRELGDFQTPSAGANARGFVATPRLTN